MISRIYVAPKGKLDFIDSYLISHKFSSDKILKIAKALTNSILEEFSINKFPLVKFAYAMEIGFKPGVTDNKGQTAKETITDLFHLKDNSTLEVYTSRIFLISKSTKLGKVKEIALSLHNPLIERSYVANFREIQKKGLPLKTPKVILGKSTTVIKVPLELKDSELEKIGKFGIKEPDGTRRGPLALNLASMKAIKEHFKKLKRDPTDIELESLAQTWSEHCKHTIFANQIDDIKDGLYKTYIQEATNLIRKQKGQRGQQDFCVSVFSDNSGGIVFDKDFLITHKVETHNSPSALDPFGGSITGILGVNRDTIGFGMGAKPVANVYGFCFADPNDTKPLFRDKELKNKMLPPKRIMDGVLEGVNVGGNCSGIPTVSGFVKYDDRYRGKPLVFVGTLGIIPRTVNKKPAHIKKARVGDYIVVVGGRVGADGIHGATFSSVVMDASSPATAVQIGDSITQKKLSDALVKEARDMNLYNSITDNGAGGLSCSVAEMAKECGGAKVSLEKVPLKYPGLRPWEIWISESQERMTLSVPKKKWETFKKLMESRGVEATVIGEFTDSGKCIVEYKQPAKGRARKIMDIDMKFLHNGLPQHYLKTIPVIKKYLEPKIPKNLSYTKSLEDLFGDKNISGFSFISEQYDHEVQASSVLKPLSGAGRINTDAQVFRPVFSSNKGVVLSSGVYPSYGDISTYDMAACAIDTAIRGVISAGGTLKHLAILDNFCWCSSYDKTRLYELKKAVKACYDYSVGYGTPFISGKDSMFNDFKGYNDKGNPVTISIPPTLLISAIGVMPDIYKTVSSEFKQPGDIIYLLGETNCEMGASEFFKMLSKEQNSNSLGHCVPKVNLKKNLKTYLALEKAIQKELIASSISVTSGGLAIALAKACVGGMLGCNVALNKMKGGADETYKKLFSESQGRVLVSVSPKNAKAFERVMKRIPYAKLGKTASPVGLRPKDKNGKIIITDKRKVIDTNVKKLHTIYHNFSNKMK